MLTIERQNNIIKSVNEYGSITASELAKMFDVSIETIRKDLMFLEKENMLVRTHGGAVSKSKQRMLKPLKERLKENSSEKRELCTYALKYINDGDIIALDEGSTSIELAKLIAIKCTDLTVVTHDLNIFNVLSQNQNIKTILCGGNYLQEENAFTGFIAVDTINKLHTDKFFLCPSGISLKSGLTENSEPLFEVQKAYLDNCDKVYVLADNEKFEKTGFLKLSKINSEYIFITDSKLNDEIYNEYKENNIVIDRGDM